MKYLVDTNLLLMAAFEPARLSLRALQILESGDSIRCFSAASIWEVAIKRALGRMDFVVDPRVLRRGLLENGYSEIGVNGYHACQVDTLPPVHKDPFDRLLIAQAQVEGLTLLTSDRRLSEYPGAIQLA